MSKKQGRSDRRRGLTRRDFLTGVGAAAGSLGLGGARPASASAPGPAAVGPKKTPVTLHVNGREHTVEIEPRVTLLRALRNHLDITGPKEVCDRGACGACNVLVDGILVNSCLMLAMDAVGKKILTAEGLVEGGRMHPIQEAFCEHDALQCGFCTPGMVMACKALLDRKRDPSLEEMKKGLAGNLCRCGTYPRIFEAVRTAAKKR